ncbi:aminotransferase class I/II-fold pyridoxal phosphate-dependent enzyme [Roseivirga sp. BDSF3-8]|uniref:aminotransferase class I/II-fold pyridoxal phosphate-dependent enzyme n=1 Tax=Roseivirga sp. BDSF3-8 TaxID=3241598 RepID=UPI003531E170
MQFEKRLESALGKRREAGLIRSLSLASEMVDFTSNDYLGLARDTELAALVRQRVLDAPAMLGSGGSRLLSGNSELAMELEAFLATYFKTDKALLYNSGYAASLGLLSTLPQRGDTVLYDELSHACIKEGIRLSSARYFSFRHNDVADLRKKILKASGQIFIVAESVYSMDGDLVPLHDMIDVARETGARIILDEAHGLGVAGSEGKGLALHAGLPEEIIATVYTFGKAIGAHGACVAASETVVDYLINFSRSFIYTTALPAHSLIAIYEAFRFFEKYPGKRQQLSENISYFNTVLTQKSGLFDNNSGAYWLSSNTAIQAFVYPGNDNVRRLARCIQDAGYDVRPILSPTVKRGYERLRVCLHAFNTRQETEALIETIKQHSA